MKVWLNPYKKWHGPTAGRTAPTVGFLVFFSDDICQ